MPKKKATSDREPRDSGVVKLAPNERQRWLVVERAAVRDKRLSWSARGLLQFCLDHPANWKASVAHLVHESPNAGRDAVRSLLLELEKYRYLGRKQVRISGRWQSVVRIYERAQGAPLEEIPLPVSHTAEDRRKESETAFAPAPSEENAQAILSFYSEMTGNHVRRGDIRKARELLREFDPDIIRLGIMISIIRSIEASTRINSLNYCTGAIEEFSGVAKRAFSQDKSFARSYLDRWRSRFLQISPNKKK